MMQSSLKKFYSSSGKVNTKNKENNYKKNFQKLIEHKDNNQ